MAPMLFTPLFLVTLASAAPNAAEAQIGAAPGPAKASVSAGVRIVSGAAIRFGQPDDRRTYSLRTSTITGEDGAKRSAQLVEFE